MALVFGDLTVRKVVVDSPATGPFGFAYRCLLRPEGPDRQPAAPVEVATGEFTLGADESRSLTALPARAICAVWETDGAGLISDADGEAKAKSADIPVGGEAEIPVLTITNRAAPSASPSASPSSSPTPSGMPTSTTPADDDDGDDSDPGGNDSGTDGVLSQTGASTAVTVVGAIAAVLVLTGIATLSASIRRRRL